MDINYIPVPLEEIVAYWVKSYKLKKGVKIVSHKYFYDPQKNKIIIELYTEKKSN